MTRKFAEWASEHGPITKIRPADPLRIRNSFPTAVRSSRIIGFDLKIIWEMSAETELAIRRGQELVLPPSNPLQAKRHLHLRQ